MNTPDEVDFAINGWDRESDPPGLGTIQKSTGFQQMQPAEKVRALNQAQRNWADWMKFKDKDDIFHDYATNMYHMEQDFGKARAKHVEEALAFDVATGYLTEGQAGKFLQHGPKGLASEPETYAKVKDRYGDGKEMTGPWVTTKVDLPGGGYAFIRHKPNADPGDPNNDRAEVAWTMYGREGTFGGVDDVKLGGALQEAKEAQQQV